MAAIGIEQLKRFPELKNKRQSLARRYDKLLSNNTVITCLKHNYDNVVPHIYVVKIKGLQDREKLKKAMLDEGIQTGVHWKPNHLLSLYRSSSTVPLTITDSIYPTLITLPLHADMTENEVDFVCEKLIKFTK